jgi:hypothetical protein
MCDPADRIRDSYGVGAVLEPGVVLDGAEVAESEAPPAATGSLADDPCAAGPVPLAVLVRSRVGRPSRAVSTQEARCRPGDAVVGAAAPALAPRPGMPAGMSRRR